MRNAIRTMTALGALALGCSDPGAFDTLGQAREPLQNSKGHIVSVPRAGSDDVDVFMSWGWIWHRTTAPSSTWTQIQATSSPPQGLAAFSLLPNNRKCVFWVHSGAVKFICQNASSPPTWSSPTTFSNEGSESIERIAAVGQLASAHVPALFALTDADGLMVKWLPSGPEVPTSWCKMGHLREGGLDSGASLGGETTDISAGYLSSNDGVWLEIATPTRFFSLMVMNNQCSSAHFVDHTSSVPDVIDRVATQRTFAGTHWVLSDGELMMPNPTPSTPTVVPGPGGVLRAIAAGNQLASDSVNTLRFFTVASTGASFMSSFENPATLATTTWTSLD